MSSKKNNARTEKWRQMLAAGLWKDKHLLATRIRKGIPAGIRSLAWPQIVGLATFREGQEGKYLYSKLANSLSNNVSEIALDIPRTFPEEEDSAVLRKSLNNVLKAISIVYPRVGYCQGMNFLALRLLQVLDDEDTFWLLHFLFDNDPALMKNFIDPSNIAQESFVFAQLLAVHCPLIAARFTAQDIQIGLFSVKWFMTLYSSVFKQELFYRVFEVYLNEGWPVLYAVGIAFLRLHQESILHNNFETNVYLINSAIAQISDNQAFLQEVFLIDIPKITIKAYTEKYLKSIDPDKNRPSLKSSTIRKREDDNTRHKMPLPQQEPHLELHFQNRGQELNFEAFSLLQDTQHSPPRQSQTRREA